jgi:RNA-binding protein
MKLSESRKKVLRGLGHRLKPVIMVGDAGLSEAFLREFDSTISHHELIKVRVRAAGRRSRDALIDELCRRGSGTLIQRTGNVALIYRPNPDNPRIPLP